MRTKYTADNMIVINLYTRISCSFSIWGDETYVKTVTYDGSVVLRDRLRRQGRQCYPDHGRGGLAKAR
jgi:hypothetical protein